MELLKVEPEEEKKKKKSPLGKPFEGHPRRFRKDLSRGGVYSLEKLFLNFRKNAP